MSQSYRLKITRPSLKLRVTSRIPAQLVGGSGITITKASGVYTFAVDESEIQDIAEDAALGVVGGAISGAIGSSIQGYDSDLAALAVNSSNGIWVRTGTGTGAARSIAASAGLTVANGNGVSGNPTIAYDINALTADASPVGTADYVVTYDASVPGHKKALLDNLPKNYTQVETGAVSRTMAQRFLGHLYADEFGAVGDDSTNDRVALQAFLDAVASSGKVGHLIPGKKYYISGGNLQIQNAGNKRGFTLFGHGAQLRTNPSETRTAIRLVRPNYAGGADARAEQAQITLLDGINFNAYQDGAGIYGIDATGVINVTIRNCAFVSGADGGTAPNVNYAAIRLRQTDPADGDTGCFWINIDNCSFKGGATGMPNAIWMEGQCNAVNITKNNFANVDTAVRLLAADRTGTDTPTAAGTPNGVMITHNWFEGVIDAIRYNGNTATVNKSRSVGLQISQNRIETVSVSGFFFSLSGLNLDSEAPPVLGPNFVSSGDWARYISNSNSLTIDVRDERVKRVTIDPGSLGAGAGAFLTTSLNVPGAAVGDHVSVETAVDTVLYLTGFVNSADTVTIRATNPSNGTIDMTSSVFTVRVRPKH